MGEVSPTFQTGPGALPLSYTEGTGSFPGVKQPGRDVDNYVHLASGHRKSTAVYVPPLGLNGLFWGKLYLYLYRAFI